MKCYKLSSIDEFKSMTKDSPKGEIPFELEEQILCIIQNSIIEDIIFSDSYNEGSHISSSRTIRFSLDADQFVIAGNKVVGYFAHVPILFPDDMSKPFERKGPFGLFLYTPSSNSSTVTIDKDYVYSSSDRDKTIIRVAEGVTVFKKDWKFEKATILYLPASIKRIEEHAFIGSLSIAKIIYGGSLEQWTQIEFENEFANPCHSRGELYINKEPLGDEVLINTPIVSNYAFYRLKCKKLTIGDNVKEIGEKAFYESEIASIRLGSSLQKMGFACFKKSNIEEISLPSSLEVIPSYCFAYSKVRNVTLPEGLKTIAGYAFIGCEEIKKISFPNSLEHIKAKAFAWCENLTRVELPPNLIELGEGAFERCGALKKVAMGDKLEVIEEGAFDCCYALSSIRLSNSLKRIKTHAFTYCPLTEIELPEGITQMDYYAFSQCKELNKVRFPESLSVIEKCFDNLVTAYLPASLEKLSICFKADAKSITLFYPKRKADFKKIKQDIGYPNGVAHCQDGDLYLHKGKTFSE